jgi:NADPH2:quinone reductase
MRAAWYDEPGPARDVLHVGEVPTPGPAPGELLVRVHASGVNPSDFKRRASVDRSRRPGGRTIPHSDGAGTVEAVGPGVDPRWVGRRVWLWNAVNRFGYGSPADGETGTAAEYVTIPPEFVAPLPDRTSFQVGACLGVPAFTAYTAVLGDGPVADRWVLVQGGAGAVGELAVQIAVEGGAEVIATVSSPAKAERARAAGAHHVIDYRAEDVIAMVRTLTGGGVDKVVEVDFAANIQHDAGMIADHGSIVSYSSTSNARPTFPYYDLQFKAVTVRTVQVFTMPQALRREAAAAIGDLLATGRLRPTIAATYPLEQIGAAHEHAERGADGQVVLTIGSGVES